MHFNYLWIMHTDAGFTYLEFAVDVIGMTDLRRYLFTFVYLG